jgi:hypothetical protein
MNLAALLEMDFPDKAADEVVPDLDSYAPAFRAANTL